MTVAHQSFLYPAVDDPPASVNTYSFTPSSTPRGILVMFHVNNNGASATGVTYGGVAMTKVDDATNAAGEPMRAEAWFLGSSIPTGTQNVVITLNTAEYLSPSIVSVSAAGDTEVIDFGIIEVDGANPQIALDSGGTDAMRYCMVTSGLSSPTNLTPISGDTSLGTRDHGSIVERISRRTSVESGNVTIGFTAASDDIAMVAVAISEISAGVPTVDGSLDVEIGFDNVLSVIPIVSASLDVELSLSGEVVSTPVLHSSLDIELDLSGTVGHPVIPTVAGALDVELTMDPELTFITIPQLSAGLDIEIDLVPQLDFIEIPQLVAALAVDLELSGELSVLQSVQASLAIELDFNAIIPPPEGAGPYEAPYILYGTGEYLYNGLPTPDSLLIVGGRELDYINGSLSIVHSIDTRCAVRFAVESNQNLDIVDGEYVALRLRGKRAFDGVVTKPTETFPGPFNRIYDIDATCFDYLAERRVVAATFESTTVEDIVRQLAADYLYEDDVAEGQITGDFLVSEALFSYITLSKALDVLAATAGYHWHIDGLRRLHFGPISLFSAPFDLDEIDEFSDKLTIDGGNREYRNRQYIRGGKAETVPRTESWKGDGEQQTFVTGFPIAREPTITVDSVAQTVGVKGIGDPNSDWFWARGSSEVTQNSSDTPLSSAQTLEISYIGLFDLVVVSTDEFAVSQRRSVEGFGTGIVDHVETDTSLVNQSAAFASAASKLNAYATRARSLTWDTEREGLDAGQLITVDLPDLNFDAVPLYIVEVTTKDRASRLIHTVRAVEGPDDNNWAAWFKKVAQPAEPLFFRENIGEEETVIVLTSTAENWEWDEVIDQTVYSCPVPSTSLFPSTTLFPC